MSDVSVGVERSNSDIRTKADVYAYADDGEHASVWAVTRVDDETVDVLTFRCEAGLVDQVGPVRSWDVDPDEPTETWAEQFADQREAAIEAARRYWSDTGGDR